MDLSHFDVVDGVSEGTVFSVLTALDIFWKVSAEFGLVLFFVVKALHSVVTQVASLSVGTVVSLCVFAQLG
jgi:hypothetical protein